MATPWRQWKTWWAPIVDPKAYVESIVPYSAEETDARHLLQRLEALLRKQQQISFSGQKHSILKGHGLDFADLREYQPGDDIRKIDWNVFARTLTPHIKEYEEDKQLNIWLFIDFSPSMQFGKERSKAELAVELAGLLGLMAHEAHHKLGFYLWDGIEGILIPPKSGYAHLQFGLHRMISSLRPDQGKGSSPQQSLPFVLQQMAQAVRHSQKNCTVFLLSDFLSDAPMDEVLVALNQVSRPVFFLLHDPSEQSIEYQGLITLRDPETGATTEFDGKDSIARAAYQQATQQHFERLEALIRKRGTLISASTGQTPNEILSGLLKQSRRAG